MASDRHMTTARKIARSYFRAEPSRRELLERDIKRELANSEREGMRRAAEIAKAMKPVKFNSFAGAGTRAPTAFEAGEHILSQAGAYNLPRVPAPIQSRAR